MSIREVSAAESPDFMIGKQSSHTDAAFAAEQKTTVLKNNECKHLTAVRGNTVAIAVADDLNFIQSPGQKVNGSIMNDSNYRLRSSFTPDSSSSTKPCFMSVM